MSCDNIQGNGHAARRSFVAFAALRTRAGRVVEQHVAFPNSMVDRITPVTTDDDRDEVRKRYGVDDAWPVVVRAVHPVGAGGRVPAGPAAVRGRRACRWSPTSSRTS
jgi:hypothetical protein